MTGTMTQDDVIAAVAATADPRLVLAAWGATARRETTRFSDLDLLCWNPHGARPPEAIGHQAAYLDLVCCDAGQAGLRTWALANSTDLSAVMFARVVGRGGPQHAQFADVVDSLWQDGPVRARLVLHVLSTAVSTARLYGPDAYRPEKFALGATRCWTALAECGQLVTGAHGQTGTWRNLRVLADSGIVPPYAPEGFLHAMELRRGCEEGAVRFEERAESYAVLGALFLASAAHLVREALPWLQQHARLAPGTVARFGTDVLGAADLAPPAPAGQRPGGETEAMMQVFLARDAATVHRLIVAPPHGASWWTRYSAVVNACTGAATLREVVDSVARAGTWWAGRNLILYAIRHPAADAGLLDHIRTFRRRLRPMDLEALDLRSAKPRPVSKGL
jgi:hypothetical protein